MAKNEKLNLKNPKQMELIYRFAICEGRMTKEEIYKVGNKEIFYRMKNGGYIKESTKGSGNYKATSKFQKLTEKTTGISYGNGCSYGHSLKINKAVSLMGKEAVYEGRFETGKMLRQEFEAYKKTDDYQRALERIQENAIRQERKAWENYNVKKDEMPHQAKIDLKSDLEICRMKQEVAFSDTPAFIPDVKLSLTREEMENAYSNMKEIYEQSPEQSREHRFMEKNLEIMEQMLVRVQPAYDVYLEIVTDSYGNRELERHANYEFMLEREVLYVC